MRRFVTALLTADCLRRNVTRLLLGLLIASAAASGAGTAVELELKGALGVATAQYIIAGIEEASERDADLVIIRMDTPGGLVEPMRDIITAILNSEIPVVTYVSPGGARADSAGTYILLASHVAAMAPTTHLGAATPVSMMGGEPDADDDSPFKLPDSSIDSETGSETGDDNPDTNEGAAESESQPAPAAPGTAMERKILNDSIAYIRGLAERHGRNVDWAERAVRDAATLTAEEALDENVIDLLSSDLDELLLAMDGREVRMESGTQVLDTKDMTVEILEPSLRIKFLSTIANPQVAVLLLFVGLYGLLLEGYNPGALVPGVVGVVSLLLAAYALQVIPVNYAGLALIVVGVVLIVAEAFVPSFGVLGLGGIVAFAVGSIIMFDSEIPGFGISIPFVVTFAIIAGLALLWMVSFLVKLQRRGAVSGEESMLGATAVAQEAFTGAGKVWLDGETWQAISNVPVAKDQEVIVESIEGLVVNVRPASNASRPAPLTQT